MSLRNYNNVTTIGTLTGPLASSATSVTVANFNNAPAAPFTATIDRNTATEEIILVTAVAGTVLTVTRGYDGTAAQAHSAGATVEHTAGAIEYTEANAHVNATSGVHGTTGALVGSQGTQSIYDKTLVSPVLSADVTAGDAAVAFIPSGATAKNLFRGVDVNGNDVIIVDSSGNVNAPTVSTTGATNVHGNLSVNGTSSLSGAVTASGTLAVTGAASLNGGATVPTGKKLTLTDAPVATTDAVNKTYVDSNRNSAQIPSSQITDAASAVTASVVVKRDANGRAQVADPAVAADIATKNYVDSQGFATAKIKSGQSSVSSNSSGVFTITHNLGTTPMFFALNLLKAAGAGNGFTFTVEAVSTTTATIQAQYNDAPWASAGPETFMWLAIA